MQNAKQQPKNQNHLKYFKFLTVVFSFSFFTFNFCQAAVLYLEPAEADYHEGDIFIVKARINTEEECINTVKARLNFSSELLEAVDFSQGDSILTIWVEPPKIDQQQGLISFIGGIPAGFCGRIPGDPEASNLLGRIIFKVKEISGEQFSAKAEFLENSQVLLNDGLGTPASLTSRKATLTVLPGPSENPLNEWQEELGADKIPPESFEIKISQDSAIFEGKYFITFQTQDKQSGVDYFMVREGEGKWHKASSPYLLKDQNLESRIIVKAIDKAGNERMAEYVPTERPKPFPYLLIILIIVALVIIYCFWRIWRRKRQDFKLNL